MPGNKLQILCTGPVETGSFQSADDVDIDLIPFVRINTVTDPAIRDQILRIADLKTDIIFSSINAVKTVTGFLKGKKPDWSVYCIGYATREAVENYFGINAIKKTGRNAEELAHLINDPKEVYFFCGNLRRAELPGILSVKGIEVNEISVYSTELTPVAIGKQYDAILFFSPSAVSSFFQKNTIPDNSMLFAIGETTAAEIRKFSGKEIFTSDIPDKISLLKKAISLLKSAGTT